MSVESLTSLLTGGISAMAVGDIIPLATGASGALVVLLAGISLLITGRVLSRGAHREVVAGKNAEIAARDAVIADKDRQIAALNVALSRERERGDAVILAAHVTREAMEGIRKAIQ